MDEQLLDILADLEFELDCKFSYSLQQGSEEVECDTGSIDYNSNYCGVITSTVREYYGILRVAGFEFNNEITKTDYIAFDKPLVVATITEGEDGEAIRLDVDFQSIADHVKAKIPNVDFGNNGYYNGKYAEMALKHKKALETAKISSMAETQKTLLKIAEMFAK